MKTKVILSAMLAVILTAGSLAQETNHKDHIWTYQGKKKVNTIGLYAGIYGSYSEVMDKPSSFLGARAGLVFNNRWTIGLAGYALNFDRKLTALSEEGAYRLEGGYSGLLVEYIKPFRQWGKLSVSVVSGMGLVQYRYDKESREGREWYNEIIDKENFAVFEPGMEFQVRLAGNWWIGAYATYRTTSPVDFKGADEDFLENYTVGASIKLGVF